MDITQPMQLASSTPVEAAENIDNSNVFAIDPDTFKTYKPDLKPEVDRISKPMEATERVGKFAAQSGEHAALVQNDVEHLNYIERQWGRLKDIPAKIGTNQEIVDLSLKKMFSPDTFTQEDDLRVMQLNEDAAGFKDYGLDGPLEEVPDFIVGTFEGLAGMAASIGKNAKLIDQATIAGMGLGAATAVGVGLATGTVATGGLLPLALLGATRVGGVVMAGTAVRSLVLEGVNSQMGATYNELSNLKNANNEPMNMDEESKRFISMGSGVVGGAIAGLVTKGVAKTIPFLNNVISPKAASAIVLDPSKAALKQMLFNIGKSMAVGGSGATLMSTYNVLKDEFSRTYDGTEASYLNALKNSEMKILRQGAEGAAVAGTITGVAGALNFGNAKKGFQAAQDKAVGDARDVSPTPTPLLPSSGGNYGEATQRAIKVLQFEEAISNMSKVAKGTDLYKLSRAQFLSLRKEIAEDSGLRQVYLDHVALEKFKEDEKKRAHVEKIIGVPTEVTNAPVQIETHKFLEAADQYPELLTMVKLMPEDPTVAEAEKYLTDLVAADEKRKEINTKLGTTDKPYISLFDGKALTEAEMIGEMHRHGQNLKTMINTAEKTPGLIDDLKLQGLKNTLKTYNEVFPDGAPIKEVTASDKMAANAFRAFGNPGSPKWKEMHKGTPLENYTGRDQALGEIEYPSLPLDESNFLNQPTMTEALSKVYPEAAVAKYNAAQLEAREFVKDEIEFAAQYEMDRVRDVEELNAVEATQQNELDRMVNDPNLAIVDKFTKNPSTSKKSYSPLAIDPDSLPKKLQKYLKNEQLKKHKVFAKPGTGLTADASARMIGVNTGENLLKILSQTPSREDILAKRMKIKEQDIQDRVNESMSLNENKVIRNYNDRAKHNQMTMKFLKDNKWTDMKGGIRQIALRPPTIPELRLKAKAVIAQTPVGKLNVNQYRIGDRQSHRIAIDAILKNEVEVAYKALEARGLNIELARETTIMIGRINRALKFARKFNKPEYIQKLKDAGSLDAANEILDVFNLNPSKKSQSVDGAYAKWVKKMLDQGQGNFELPERLTSVKQSVRDMTAEQVLAVVDRLKNINKQADMKNKLYTKFEAKKMIESQEAIAAELNAVATKSPDYDLKRGDVNKVQSESLTHSQEFGMNLKGILAIADRAQYIILKLDNDVVAGPFNQFLWRPIKQGRAAKGKMMIEIKNEIDKHIKEYGQKDFENLNTVFLEIPEFQSVPELRRITKGQLLKLMMNFGNAGNKKRLTNFDSLPIETFQSVFDQYLDERDVHFVQHGVFNVWESLKPHVAKLQMESEGTEANFVEAEAFVHKGKVYPGGYYPIQYVKDLTNKEKLLGSAGLSQMEKFHQRYSAQAMTNQDYLETRTDSKRKLDMSLTGIGHGLEQVIHDIHLRMPIRDTAQLLSNPDIERDIVAIAGVEGYNGIVDNVIDSSESVQMMNYNATDGILLNWINKSNAGIQSAFIVLNPTSMAVQLTSIGLAVDRMGGQSGMKYIGMTLSKFAANPTLWRQFFDFAARIHPPINEVRENLDSYAANAINRMMPKKNALNNPRERALNAISEFGFSTLLGTVDQFNKTLVATAAYTQFISGDAPGYSMKDIANLTPAELDAKASQYASEVTELTQTHGSIQNLSPIQKNKFTKPLLLFYNDANNVHNAMKASARKAKYKFKESGDEASRGEWRKASKAAAGGVAGIMGTMMIYSLMKLYEKTTRGQETPLTDMGDKSVVDVGLESAKFFLQEPVDTFWGSSPILRDMSFALDRPGIEKVNVKFPFNKQYDDLGTTFLGLNAFLGLSEDEMTDEQMRAAIYSLGYMKPGFPSAFVYKYIMQPDWDTPLIQPGEWQQLSNRIGAWLEKHRDDEEIPAEFIKDLENIRNQIDPKLPETPDSSSAIDIIKQIESGAKWWAKNPNSSAAGLYQFTEGTWNDIMDRAPELGLTENGRISKDTSQQDKAMTWFTEQNIKSLQSAGIAITTESIYAAHFLGAEGAIKVLGASADTKLKTLVSDQVIEANGFSKNMKVKDFKEWLENKTTAAQLHINQQAANEIDKMLR